MLQIFWHSTIFSKVKFGGDTKTHGMKAKQNKNKKYFPLNKCLFIFANMLIVSEETICMFTQLKKLAVRISKK